MMGLAASAQTQLLPDLFSSRGGGILRTCDTSLHVGFNTTFGNYYQCTFTPQVVPGNTVVDNMVWSYYYNGTFEQQFTPTLQLSYPGQQPYPVCLTVNAYDVAAMQPCSTTVCDMITPLPDVSCVSLQAAFSIASVDGNNITFQDNSVFDGIIQTSYWSFGDGTSTTTAGPSHPFTGPGPFEVCLTVVGPPPVFCTSTLCQYLYLGPGNVDCPLLIHHGYAMVQADNLVGVLDTSNTSGMDHRIEWDFGDGATADGNVAVHAYGTSGEFQLCGTLRAWGPLLADTCITSLCRMVQAFPAVGMEEGLRPGWSASPNPFRDVLRIQGPLEGRAQLMVVDMSGRAVHTGTVIANSSIDLAHLDTGPYVLLITDMSGTAAWRFIKE